MQPNLADADESGLSQEEKNPSRKHSSVNVNQNARQWRKDHAGQKVSVRKSKENCGQHHERHDGEKDVVCAGTNRTHD
jgi:hypothetical protein